MGRCGKIARLIFCRTSSLVIAVNKILLVAGLTAFALNALAADAPKPTVYNRVHGEYTELDKQFVAAYEAKFTVVNVRDEDAAQYTPPEPTEGELPRTFRTGDGKFLGGDVLAGFVISPEGRVTDPVILKSSDQRLNAPALKAMEEWRFKPGKVNGSVVATSAAQNFSFAATPEEFVTQVMEPTGGKILRPKDWFYREAHEGPKYSWTLSREDVEGEGHYDTGFRIQCFNKVKEGTGLTAKEFVMKFVQGKKEGEAQVLAECEPKDQGLFTRMCLETEEGPFHILYSLFWGSDDMDVAVIAIAGTPRELWDVYAPTFQKMGTFELIDMKRFEKEAPDEKDQNGEGAASR